LYVISEQINDDDDDELFAVTKRYPVCRTCDDLLQQLPPGECVLNVVLSGSARAFLLVSTRTGFLKVHLDRREVEETTVTVASRDQVSILTFAVDVEAQTVYWVDDRSATIWSSSLSDYNQRNLVGSFHFSHYSGGTGIPHLWGWGLDPSLYSVLSFSLPLSRFFLTFAFDQAI